VVEQFAHRRRADLEDGVRPRTHRDRDGLVRDPFEVVALGVDHVDEEVRVQIERRVDVGRVRLAGVDREGAAALLAGGALRGERVVVRAGGTVAVGDVQHGRVAAPEDERVDAGVRPRLAERSRPLNARLAEVKTRDGPGPPHEPERPPHRRHQFRAVGGREPSVLQAVRRRDGLVEREAHGRLLRHGVPEVGVRVDERWYHDVRRLGVRLLDGLDPTVLDDDAPSDGFQGGSGEDGPSDRLHTTTPRSEPI